MDKKTARIRRALRSRVKIRKQNAARLCVHRTPRHIYAQVIAADGATVVAAASTVQKDIAGTLTNTGNVDAAKRIGQMIAERAKEAGVDLVAFDRSGFKYHGRVKALADSAREAGLKF